VVGDDLSRRVDDDVQRSPSQPVGIDHLELRVGDRRISRSWIPPDSIIPYLSRRKTVTFKVIDAYRLAGAPLNVIIDPSGKVVSYHEGFLEGKRETRGGNREVPAAALGEGRNGRTG